MSHAHSTTKRRTFKHLTAYQRGQIEAMLRLGVPKVKIAKDLGIARSTPYAEIKRGTVTQKRSDWTYYEQYFAQSGQIRYERNRENSGKPSKFNAAKDFIKHVEGYILKHGYAPEKSTDAVLLAADERKQRKRHLIKIRAKTTEAVAEGIAKLRVLYGVQFSQVFRTITCDNGSEFARLQEAVPETKVYYAHPYAPWERGTNEKQNALVRYFIPKGMDMTNLTEEDVQRVEDWINTLPRKIIGYETPQARFDAVLKNLRP